MSGYIGNSPVPQATQTRDVFTATGGQTSFATSGYTPGYVDVWLNGVKLVDGSDFTASNGSDVVLTSGATAGDTLEVLSYSTYEVANQAFTGDFSVDGTTFKVDSTNNRVAVGTSTPDSTFVVNATNARQKITDGTNTLSMGQFDGLTNQIGSAGRDLYLLTSGANSVKFGTNNTERMNLDNSGRLTLPYQPAFSAYFNVSSPTPYTAGSRVLNFTNVSYNVGNHYDGTNKFTAPVAGRYVFLVDRALNTYGANQVIRHPSMGFNVNGTTNYGVNTGVSTSSAVGASDYTHFTVSMATVLDLNANDYVQIEFNYSNSPSILYEYASSWFTGYLLG